VAVPAFAQTSLEGYGGQGGPPLVSNGAPNQSQPGSQSSTPATKPVSTAGPRRNDDGTLAFTGFDLLLAAGGGLLMLGFGLVLRRVARAPDLA
jgi:hypothetical protein